jgi:hypothetical protein
MASEPSDPGARRFAEGASSRACCVWLLGAAGPDLANAPMSVEAMAAALGAAFGPNAVAVEAAQSLEELGELIEDGREVIALVDAGPLWGQASASAGAAFNHAVVVLEVRRDAASGQVVGARVADPARPEAPTDLDEAGLAQAWLGSGGRLVTVLRDPP